MYSFFSIFEKTRKNKKNKKQKNEKNPTICKYQTLKIKQWLKLTFVETRYTIITITLPTYLKKYSLSPSSNSINSWLYSPSLFLFWKMDLTQNLLFLAQFILGFLQRQKIIHHHLKFFLIHLVVLASETLYNYTTILQCERLQVIFTTIQNMLIVVIVILHIRCNRYFKLSENQALMDVLSFS